MGKVVAPYPLNKMKQKVYIISWMTILNAYDLISTYIMSPDLSLEGNWVVQTFNGGWLLLITDCLVWQALYSIPIFYALNHTSHSTLKTQKKIILSWCKSIFAGYLVMKLLIGTDNLLSTYCAAYLREHALLDVQVKQHFCWSIDLQSPPWLSIKGKLVYIYGFIPPPTKHLFMTILIGLTVLIKTICFYYSFKTNDTNPNPINT